MITDNGLEGNRIDSWDEVPLGIDLLIWDDNEDCWRVGHVVNRGDMFEAVDGSVYDNLQREHPALVIDNPTHWSYLPVRPDLVREI